MRRSAPNSLQSFLSGVVLPLSSLALLPISLIAVVFTVVRERKSVNPKNGQCVIISGGRMTKGLMLARAFHRAGWKVIGVDEEGWGELCPMRFSNAIDSFHLLPPATDFEAYQRTLCTLATDHNATLFIPVSGVTSSVQDAMIAKAMPQGCKVFVQDQETMEDLHDKDRFMALLDKLGIRTPASATVSSVDDAMGFLSTAKPRFVAKCLGIDENRGDLTLYPLEGDLAGTRLTLEALSITPENPYQLQEFIPGQEWCTHASVVDGQLTSFVACPSNDMLMTYEDGTNEDIGRQAEAWTRDFLKRLKAHGRELNGHFSFDFIASDQLYPIECNARVHTAIILLPMDQIASCYSPRDVLRPTQGVTPRSWIYNDIIMRYIPMLLPEVLLRRLHPSLAYKITQDTRPSEAPLKWRVDPTLTNDWLPFLVLWHLYWPCLLMTRWWQGKRWTRLNVSTGRIFSA